MIDYELVNMFADRPFAGSPLGVVPDAGALSADAMQAVATEINADETAFVLAPSSVDATYRIRVFTPASESPHGGHSSVGTAATLARLGAIPTGPVVQECGAGRQHLVAGRDRATLIGKGPLPGVDIDPEPLLAAVGLTGADLGRCGPRAAGFSARFPFLEVSDEAVVRARPDYRRLCALAVPALFLFSWHNGTRSAHARLFAPGFGMPEDPACGPVALALGVWLAEAGLFPDTDGAHEYLIRQGAEIGRCSTLRCTTDLWHGQVDRVTVTGAVTPVATGRMAVPTDH